MAVLRADSNVMLEDLNPIQRWARRQNAIPRPRIVELNIDTVVSHLAHQSRLSQVELPLLAAPQVVGTTFFALVAEIPSNDLVVWDLPCTHDALTPMCDLLVPEPVSEN